MDNDLSPSSILFQGESTLPLELLCQILDWLCFFPTLSIVKINAILHIVRYAVIRRDIIYLLQDSETAFPNV